MPPQEHEISNMRKEEAANLLAAINLGSGVAETDDLLESARVETSVFLDLLGDRVDLVPGTKGSGKTALYRMFVDFFARIPSKATPSRYSTWHPAATGLDLPGL